MMGRLGERRTKGMILWPLLLPSCHTAQTQRVPGVHLSVRASCMLSCSVTSDSLRPHGLEPARLVCPWDFPSKNTGVGCHFLLQGFFLTQGSNPHPLCLLHWQADCLPLNHLESPGVNGTWLLMVLQNCLDLLHFEVKVRGRRLGFGEG